jgi:hypothetical protein
MWNKEILKFKMRRTSVFLKCMGRKEYAEQSLEMVCICIRERESI